MLQFLRMGSKRTKTIWWVLIIITVVTFLGGFVFLVGVGLDTSLSARSRGDLGAVIGARITRTDFAAALDRYAIDENTAIVLVTRGHRQDEESLRHCVGRGAGYLGMIGSKRRTATVLAHLRDEGFDAAELDRVRTPIGLDIGAETPEEIAVSLVAEVVMLRHGGTGAPMYRRRRAAVGTVAEGGQPAG